MNGEKVERVSSFEIFLYDQYFTQVIQLILKDKQKLSSASGARWRLHHGVGLLLSSTDRKTGQNLNQGRVTPEILVENPLQRPRESFTFQHQKESRKNRWRRGIPSVAKVQTSARQNIEPGLKSSPVLLEELLQNTRKFNFTFSLFVID